MKKFLFLLIPLLLLVILYFSIYRDNKQIVQGQVIQDPVRGWGIKIKKIFFNKTVWEFDLPLELRRVGIKVICVRKVVDVIWMSPKDVVWDEKCTENIR